MPGATTRSTRQPPPSVRPRTIPTNSFDDHRHSVGRHSQQHLEQRENVGSPGPGICVAQRGHHQPDRQHVGFSMDGAGRHVLVPGGGQPLLPLRFARGAGHAPKEWHYDASNSKLYLQAPGGANPGSQTVEVRKRQLGFDLGSQSYVNVSGFALKAASINVAGNHNLINNCQILYPTPFGDPNGYAGQDGVVLSGQYNTISNSEIGYSWGDGVTLKGPNNTVTNNIIHDVNWSGTASAGVDAVYAGSNSTISNNTIYNSGRDGILLGLATNTPNTAVLHNDVSRFGFLAQDLGGLYTWNADNAGSVIAYNRVHDSRGAGIKAGIYLDDYVNGVTAHHNLVYDTTRGMYVKGTNNNAYNNTLWNVPDGAVVRSYADPPTSTQVLNNLSNNTEFQGATVSNNRYQTADQFTNSATGDYTLTRQQLGLQPRSYVQAGGGLRHGDFGHYRRLHRLSARCRRVRNGQLRPGRPAQTSEPGCLRTRWPHH